MDKRTRTKPPTGLRKRLYNAAAGFREMACWNWMWDADLFGVIDPAGGETAYCSVMGRDCQHFAITAFLGPEGLKGFYRIRDEEIELRRIDAFLSQRFLTVSFEERESLEEEDIRILEHVGYRAVGPHAWPRIRSHSPGFEPRGVDAREAEFIVHILEQAMGVALRFRDDPGLLAPPGGKGYLVRVPERTADGLRWRDGRITPVSDGESTVPAEPLDEVRIARIKKNIPRTPDTWEIDCFYLPGPVREKGRRGYYPRVMLCVDHDSPAILGFHTASPSRYPEEFPRQLMTFIEKNELIPDTILTGAVETALMLEPAAAALRINVELSEDIELLIEAGSGLLENLCGGGGGDTDAAACERGGGAEAPMSERGGGVDTAEPSESDVDTEGPLSEDGNSVDTAEPHLSEREERLSNSFEGFGLDEMRALLFSPFDPETSPLRINEETDEEMLRKAPIFDHVIKYLDLIGKHEPVKLTKKGNLPLKIVRRLREMDFPAFDGLDISVSIRSEENAPYIHLINLLTGIAGFTTKRRGTMTLTGKYKRTSVRYSAGELYRRLLETFVTTYNWGYEDRYEDTRIIQNGFGFSLYLVTRYGGEGREARFYAERFLDAFPIALDDFGGDDSLIGQERYESCYCLRVLDRFMKRFGLIDFPDEGLSHHDEEKIVIKTELFETLITWNLSPG